MREHTSHPSHAGRDPTEKMASDLSRVGFIITLTLISINLRPMLIGLPRALEWIRDSLPLSAGAIGTLITLPMLGFRVLAPCMPRLRRYMSSEKLILLSPGILVIGIG